MPEVESQLARIRAAWMAGRGAADQTPPAWREAVGDGAGAEAALAALTGQALQMLFRPVAPGLQPRALLPALTAPTPPEAARPRIRRILAARRSEDGGDRSLVLFLAARGYAMHPADWLPRATNDWAPALYAPWLAWAASEIATASADALTAETYDSWPWAERRASLVAMRRGDAGGARAIIAARAGAEPAERRLKLLEVLEQGLSADDAPVLETFASDRSDRVQALVRRLLARLGRGAGDPALAQELSAMVELARIGLLKRRTQLKLMPLKTQVQENRRRELLAVVTLAELAKALGVQETALVETLPVGEVWPLNTFATMVEETASAPAWRALFDLALQETDASVDLALILGRRASTDERTAALSGVLARDASAGFQGSLAFAGDALGVAGGRVLPQTPGYRALMELLRNAPSDDVRTPPPMLAIGLGNLGLLLEPAAAASVLDNCLTAGLSSADPRLDMLHLNIALKPERST